MKKYLLFYYQGYYPRGAFNDFVETFNSKKEVFNYINKLPKSLKEQVSDGHIEFQVLNKETMHIVTINDIDFLEMVLDNNKYTLPKQESYFDYLVEDCEIEDRLDIQ